MNYDFWEDWEEKTEQEIEYIKALKKARAFILRRLPRKKIHAIYVKGSFPRRELALRSDIDIVIVTTDSRLLGKIDNLRKQFNEKLKPAEIVTPFSLWELKNSKSYSRKKTPQVFLFHLKHHRLIYGKSVIVDSSKIRDAKHRLKGLINFLEKEYIPAFRKGTSWGFRYLAKQTFWLVDLELLIKQGHSPHTFQGMAKAIEDKRHIVHEAIRIRHLSVSTTRDPELRKRFLRRFIRYMNRLKKLI